MKNRKENETKTKRQLKINWKILPLQFIMALFPLILYSYAGYSGFSAYDWNSLNDFYIDIFLHGKMRVFMVLAIVLLCLIVLKLVFMEKAGRKKALLAFIPLFIYAAFVILSTVCSTNINFSLYGSQDAKEPMGVLLGYVLAAFYAYLVVESKEDMMGIVSSAVFGGTCMAVIGVLQAAGIDLVSAEPTQLLYSSKEFFNIYGYLVIRFPVGQTYVTLFNPNYVGTYVAMYLPLLLIGLFCYKQIWKKAVCVLTFVGLLITLFASNSLTGLIASFGVALTFLFFLCRELWKRWYVLIPGLTFLLMCFSLFDTYQDNRWTNDILRALELPSDNSLVTGVDTTGNAVKVLYKDTEYSVRMTVSETSFDYIVREGKEEREVTFDETRENAYFTLANGDEITIKAANYEGAQAFSLDINGYDFFFTNQVVKGNYKFIDTKFGRLNECIIAENLFPTHESAASGRGYVWGRTIPMLKDYIFIGSGPDTFTIVFPQSDYVARYKCHYAESIFTRPHNFYLQMGVQTGVVSLVAFLAFYAIYFVGSCKRYFLRKLDKMEQWCGFSVFTCTIGFLAAGLANDSLIVVTPMFYVLLGLGMAINHKLCPLEKKVKKSEENEKGSK